MIRFFLDTSVLFAAVYSTTGHARDLLKAAESEEITLVTSKYVLAEARRVLVDKSPQRYLVFDYLMTKLPWEMVEPTKGQVLTAAKYVEDINDAPIIAAARKAKVQALVTFDRKHLLGRPTIATYLRAKVLTAREAVELLK
jgi:predicted nucleic acid-binding protein